MKLAPIVLFAYNRPGHARKVLESLAKNPEAKESYLHVFIDFPKSDADADNWLKTIKVCEQFQFEFSSMVMTRRVVHNGCKRNVGRGMDDVFRYFDRAIVLEDDIVVSKDFLSFMNDGLYYYEDQPTIFSITGSCPNVITGPEDTFLYPRFWSHGWATWRERWYSIDFNVQDPELFKSGGIDQNPMLWKAIHGKVDSWAIYASYASRNKFTVFPRVAKCKNIGFDGGGNSAKKTHLWDSELSEESLRHIAPFHDLGIAKQIDRKFRSKGTILGYIGATVRHCIFMIQYHLSKAINKW